MVCYILSIIECLVTGVEMAGVERLSGCPLQDTDLVKKFLGNDAHVLSLLTDLKSDR